MHKTVNPEERWECLFGSRHLYRAEFLKGLLEDEGITAVIVNKQDSSYLFGDIEVFVRLDDFLHAQQVLKKFSEDE